MLLLHVADSAKGAQDIGEDDLGEEKEPAVEEEIEAEPGMLKRRLRLDRESQIGNRI
jgi:hypothetical protein